MSELQPAIRRVVVYEDRAEVFRGCPLALEPGAHAVVVAGLSAVVVDRQVVAWTEDAAGNRTRVSGVRVVRRQEAREAVPEDLVAALKEAERARDAARRVYDRCSGRRATLTTQLGQLAEEAGLAARADQAPADFGGAVAGALEALESALASAVEAEQSARSVLTEAHDEVERIQGLVTGPERDRVHRLVADVHLDLRIDADAPATALLLSTITPCAAWRPNHEARLTGADQVRWVRRATVWQNTGEDWSDAEVVLSTARPGTAARLPDLHADRVRLRQKTAEERRTIVVQHREEAVGRPDEPDGVPGVDDGDEIQVLAVPGRVTVRSDGRPHGFEIDGFQTSGPTDRICVPARGRQVFWRATLSNEGGQPLLAGPVTLSRDGAFMGIADVPYVGPGETFELSFGSDDRFVVRHRRRRVEEDRLLGRDRVHFVEEVELLNGDRVPHRVEVRLRLPVSELGQVKVVPSLDHCSEGKPAPDDDGILGLAVDIEPGARREVRLGFHFETSGEVVLPDPW